MKYLILMLLVSFNFIACKVPESQLIQQVKSATVWIGNDSGHGTGVFIDSGFHDNALLTNAHVCNFVALGLLQGQELVLKVDDEVVHPLILSIYLNQDTDLCLFKLGPLEKNHTSLKLAQSSKLYEPVIVMGYPLDYPLNLVKGYTSYEQEDALHPHNRMIVVVASIFPGNSGSAVVNLDGEVVALISEGDNRTSFGGAVTLEHIKEFLLSGYAH